MNGFNKCIHGGVPVLHTVEIIVAQFRYGGGQHRLDAPAPLLARVIVPVAIDEEQARLDTGRFSDTKDHIGV